jgi:beta-carotene/zeaxanthin 4-ketolase
MDETAMNQVSTARSDSWKGLLSALIIIVVWLASLIFALSSELSRVPVGLIVLMMLWQTFLYTGLFITAHDAMHGAVFPGNKNVNKFFGVLSVSLYALFSYALLLDKHWRHHRFSGTEQDPDFHDGRHKGFWRWYFHFMFTYIGWKQILGMAIVFNVLNHLLGIPTLNLLLFWVTPALLSTLQLFYFGTFLPHRELEEPFTDKHRARSNDYRVLLSFLSCYHFGYHWEHHAYPYVPWWKLPSMRRQGQ